MAAKFAQFIIIILCASSLSWAQDPNAPVAPSAGTNPIAEKEIEVAIGIDVIEKVDFDFSPKVNIGNESLLRLILVPQKGEILFKGIKPGKTTVMVRDNLGDVRLKYTVSITASGKSNTVSELRELIGNVEGLEIGISGGKVFVGGEIIVPDDIGRVSAVLASYTDVLRLYELSPQTQRVIARRMTDELNKSGLKEVSVRIMNKVYVLEGVVSSKEKRDDAERIASIYLPPKIASLATGEGRFQSKEDKDIYNFISVNPQKEAPPAPKLLKITSQFVELTKNYGRVFAFKWAPLMGEDASQIQFGQTRTGNITSTSSGTLSATISNLFPKLNAAKSAGYARIVQSGMIVMREGADSATIRKTTNTPFAIGTGEFQKAASAQVGLTMTVRQPKILEQEKIELPLSFSVDLQVGNDATITTNNSVDTNLIIKNKESAAIGGVVQNQSSTEYDKSDPAPTTATTGTGAATPLFRLLRSKNYTTTKNQYVIFVTPEIIESASVGTEEIRKKFRRRE